MYTREEDSSAAASRVRSVLFVPLHEGQTLLGAMLMYFAERRQLSQTELELVDVRGAQAAHTFDAAQQQVKAKEVALMSERNRIARELHDSVTHALFAISLIAESLPQTWQSHPEAALESVAKLHPLAQGALAELRALLLELRADEPVDRNLGDLLRELGDRTRAFYDLPVTTTIVGDCPLPKQVQAAMYRIAQEALNNTYRHAHANRATLQLHCQARGAVVLRVSDNGKGMSLQNAGAHQLGLRIMRERAMEIGASFTITSEPGTAKMRYGSRRLRPRTRAGRQFTFLRQAQDSEAKRVDGACQARRACGAPHTPWTFRAHAMSRGPGRSPGHGDGSDVGGRPGR